MNSSYRGYEINVTREKCLGGWSMIYFSITRESDGREFVASFEDSEEKVRDKVKQLHERVDNELAEDDPWCERADEEQGRL